MNIEKMLTFLVKGGEVISSAKRINKAASAVRVISYISLAVLLVVNIIGVTGAVKENI